MRIIVCGSRNASAVPWAKRVFKFLDDLNDADDNDVITEVIHGGASGIDYFAGKWA